MGRKLCIIGFCRSIEMLSDVVEDTVLEHGGEVYLLISPLSFFGSDPSMYQFDWCCMRSPSFLCTLTLCFHCISDHLLHHICS